ncbi:GGDEF domain-containing protein [Pelomonas sp. UHG3]|uniref:GGDEF domain-containing protein n=1 Tax=Roseateles hydrophilus TaxID=2975054 RepID=A0ACC6CA24_9BURK|nr:GGDEF domain-containing protein [Pelomonas sp. UHG3]MCY4745255.1 GGDEF domain-containing protein [Pelomonas sp. UHG3]
MSWTDALFALLPLQALAAALVLMAFIGWRHANAGGRWSQLGLLALGLGLTLAGPAWAQHVPLAPRALHSLGLALVSGGVSALWWAAGLWLMPHRGRWLMGAAPLLLGAGHAVLWPQAELARTLADLVLAAQLTALGVALTRPGREQVLHGLHHGRWRLLGLSAVLPLLVALLARAGATLLGHAGPGPDLLLAVTGQLALLLALPLLLLAWRGQTEAELARLAQTDGLTGLADRHAFQARSVDFIAMARRFDEPLALVLLELDDFAALQAEHGPEVGDRALALFASCVQTQMRLGDLAGRLAGEQCGVLMARCLPEGPQALDARLRAALAERAPAELGLALSYSAGWARLRPGDRGLPDLLRRAETALYETRRAGGGLLTAEPGVAD